jgi:predicted GNAT family acetyltransferase
MDLIRVTKENLASEHICCAISGKEADAKKLWMENALDDGLTFVKGNVRGKCFIEYIPSEKAWAPINADGWMYINCFWVSGQFKGQGFSNLLLNECIKDAKEQGKKGLVILSSVKKSGFLSDPKYLRYKGFILADQASPYFELMYLPFGESEDKPSFKSQVKKSLSNTKTGLEIFYTTQCPFTSKYVPLLLKVAESKNISCVAKQFMTSKEAQNGPSPFSTFSIFYNGNFITHEIQSEAKFEKMISELIYEHNPS